MEDNVKITFSECDVGEPELLQRDVMMGRRGREAELFEDTEITE